MAIRASAPGLTACAALFMLGACVKSGGLDAAGGNGGAAIGNLQILGTEPASNAVQVPLGAAIEVRFDAAIDEGALTEDDFTLEDPKQNVVRGTFSSRDGGKTVVFQPGAALEGATDYEFHLQPTICDTSFRTLDREVTIRFRTLDTEPPLVVSSSVQPNAVGVDRKTGFSVVFNEAIDPASVDGNRVMLKDAWGTVFPMQLLVVGPGLQATPLQDLPGSRSFVLSVRGGGGGITDRAGNALAKTWAVRFKTAADSRAPLFVGSDPADQGFGVSPRARLALTFDESMDPNSYEPANLRVEDAFLNTVAMTVTLSPDRKTVYLMPARALAVNEDYKIHVGGGPTGMTDASGNPLAKSRVIAFTTGADTTPPVVASSAPRDGERRISPNVQLELHFQEPVKGSTVSRKTVRLWRGTTPVYITPSISPSGTLLTVTPGALLDKNTSYRLDLAGGYDGILDRAGNPAAAFSLSFVTSDSRELPRFVTSPQDGASAIPASDRLAAIASTPLDPTTVTATTVRVQTLGAGGGTISGKISLTRGRRAIVFEPFQRLPTGATVRITLAGGYSGIRTEAGNWTTSDSISTFRLGFHNDVIAPDIRVTLNDVAATRNTGLAVPPFGFTINSRAWDTAGTVDASTLEFDLSGPTPLSSDELFGMSAMAGSLTTATLIDREHALDEGDYSLRLTIRDLAGNPSNVATIAFTVTSATTDKRPFERTQLVWVQFDSDREGNGRGDGVADFDEDLLDYGLAAKGDPIGRNAWLRQLVVDGAIRVANRCYQRAANSARLTNSVNLRIVTRQPCRAPHMKMAVGGPDPGGRTGRKYGDDSTGILGRALFDSRNATPNESNTSTAPGLGVFTGELFLYQARLFLDLYPHFVTTFGRTFKGLSPHMGGTPAGAHALDAKVLAATFDYQKARPAERARFDAVMKAADDLAVVTGVILAHEIGHSVGLVESGKPSHGLHGDSSLHNATTGINDVMSAIIGYESLVTVEFAFRPLNLAYLRETVLLK